MADFSKIPAKDIDGNDIYLDVRKPLGNALYYQSQDLAGSELGRKIYLSTNDIVLTDNEKALVRNMAKQVLTYIAQQGIEQSIADV